MKKYLISYDANTNTILKAGIINSELGQSVTKFYLEKRKIGESKTAQATWTSDDLKRIMDEQSIENIGFSKEEVEKYFNWTFHHQTSISKLIKTKADWKLSDMAGYSSVFLPFGTFSFNFGEATQNKCSVFVTDEKTGERIHYSCFVGGVIPDPYNLNFTEEIEDAIREYLKEEGHILFYAKTNCFEKSRQAVAAILGRIDGSTHGSRYRVPRSSISAFPCGH